MSVGMVVARLVLRVRPMTLRTAETARRSAVDSVDEMPSRRLRRRFRFERHLRRGRTVITVAPLGDAGGPEILYLHGGAYVHGMVGILWSLVADLVKRTGATVTVPLYRLAPKAGADSEYPFLASLLHELQERADRGVVVAGDSAGAGLALGLAIQARDEGTRPPAALLLFSPWVDVTMTNPAIADVASKDLILGLDGLAWSGRAWAGARDLTDPMISPLHDSLAGLPPMHIHQGDRDILRPDAELFAAKARRAGTECSLHLYRGAFHDFVGVPYLPESRKALADAARVVANAG